MGLFNGLVLEKTGTWFKIKMSSVTSYQYRKPHCGDKTVLRSSYLHNGNSYLDVMASLYQMGPEETNQCWSPAGSCLCPGISVHSSRSNGSRINRMPLIMENEAVMSDTGRRESWNRSQLQGTGNKRETHSNKLAIWNMSHILVIKQCK